MVESGWTGGRARKDGVVVDGVEEEEDGIECWRESWRLEWRGRARGEERRGWMREGGVGERLNGWLLEEESVVGRDVRSGGWRRNWRVCCSEDETQ